MTTNNIYNKKITNVRKFSNTIETTIQINRFDKRKRISVNELTDIYANIRSRFPKSKIMVRAMNIKQMFTFKGFDDDELSLYDYDEYLKGKVKEEVKFSKFLYTQITILQDIPTKTKTKREPTIKKFKNKKI